jgi:hypothetical protein
MLDSRGIHAIIEAEYILCSCWTVGGYMLYHRGRILYVLDSRGIHAILQRRNTVHAEQ